MFDPLNPTQNPMGPVVPPVDPMVPAGQIPAPPLQAPTAPASIGTPPAAEHVGAWDQFFQKLSSDQNLQQSFFKAGAHMAQPLAPGQTGGAKILEGAAAGLDEYSSLQDRDLKRQTQQAELAGVNARTGLTGSQQTGLEASTAGQGIQNVTNQSMQESQIATAAANAGVAESQNTIQGVAATNADQTYTNTQNKVLAEIEALKATTEAAGSPGSKMGPAEHLARSIAQARLDRGDFDTFDEAFLDSTEWVSKQGVQKSWQVFASEMKAADRYAFMPDSRKAKYDANIKPMEEFYLSGPSLVTPRGNPVADNPVKNAARTKAIKEAVAAGYTPERAARDVDAKIRERDGIK